MSGLEALGALASAAQIAAYVLKAAAFLSDVYKRFKDAPERIKQHAQRIKLLIRIIEEIKETQSFHTTLVLHQLEHTIAQANNLQIILVKVQGQYTQQSFRRRYWEILNSRKETQILEALDNLEKDKTILSLCLNAAHTRLLNDVRREVTRKDSDMPQGKPHRIPQEQRFGGQGIGRAPPTPPPSSVALMDSDQHSNSQLPSRENSETGVMFLPRSDADSGQELEPQSKTITVDEPTCNNALQNNGHYGPGAILANIIIRKPKAENKGIQNNGYTSDQSFFASSSKTAD